MSAAKSLKKLAIPPVAQAAWSVLEARGYKLSAGVLDKDLNVIRPDGTAIAFSKLLGEDDSRDYDDVLTDALEEALLSYGCTQTQSGRFRVPGVKSTATLQVAARRVYNQQRQEIERELEATTDKRLLAAAARTGSYTHPLLLNPVTPTAIVDAIAAAYHKLLADSSSALSLSRLRHNIDEFISKHPSLSEKQIRRMYKRRYFGLDPMFASHPSLGPQLQREYLDESLQRAGDVGTLARLAANPSLEPDMAEKIWQLVIDPPKYIEDEDGDRYRIGEAIDSYRNAILIALAGNAATPTPILAHLAAADEPQLDRELAENPRLPELPASVAERVLQEGAEDVIAAAGGNVLHGELDMLARHGNYHRIVVQKLDDGSFHVMEWPSEGFELRAGVSIPLPQAGEVADQSESRRLLTPPNRRYGEMDERELRQRIRALLLDDWPAPYNRELRARRRDVATMVAQARARFEQTVQHGKRELLERLLVAVNDGLSVEQAAELAGLDPAEVAQAVSEAEARQMIRRRR